MIEHIENILFAFHRNRSLEQYMLRKEAEINIKGKFHSASAAGGCLLKHKFKHEKIPFSIDPKSERILNLGNLIHHDFEEAVEWFLKNQSKANDILMENNISPAMTDNKTILSTEGMLINNRLNVKCIYDYLEILKDKRVAIIVDYKTAKSVAFSMQFSGKADWQKASIRREQNDREQGIYTGYELQLATIGIIVTEHFSHLIDEVVLINAYYKKDDSVMKYKCVTGEQPFEVKKSMLKSLANNDKFFAKPTLFSAAESYWKLVNEATDSIKPGDYGSPMAGWECKWSSGQCSYYDHCSKENPGFFANAK